MAHHRERLGDDDELFRVVVIHNYTREYGKKNEMTLVEGEVIKVVEKVNEAWWYGRVTDKSGNTIKQGVFPVVHVKLLEDELYAVTDPLNSRPASIMSYRSSHFTPSAIHSRASSPESMDQSVSPPPAFVDLGSGPHLGNTTGGLGIPQFSLNNDIEVPTSELQEKDAEVFHEDYSYPDGDLVLKSTDGTLFRVHSLIIKLSSNYFQGLLEKPQPRNAVWMGPIPVDDDDKTLLALLDIIYPNKTFHLDISTSFDVYKNICRSAEKYMMLSAISTMRGLSSLALELYSPIQVYGVVTELGWEKESKVASIATLDCSLYSEKSQEHLTICGPRALLQLINLHRKRRAQLLENLSYQNISIPTTWERIRIKSEANGKCAHEGACITSSTWSGFLYRVSAEMENCPRGGRLREKAFYDGYEFAYLSATTRISPDPVSPFSFNNLTPPPVKEKKPSCGIDKESLMKIVIENLESLPNSI